MDWDEIVAKWSKLADQMDGGGNARMRQLADSPEGGLEFPAAIFRASTNVSHIAKIGDELFETNEL